MKITHLVQRTNEEWIIALSDPVSEDALSDLGNILICGLRSSLSSRITTDLDSIIEEIVQNALQNIRKNIHSFHGHSQFITWAMKIAVHVAFGELRTGRLENVSQEDIENTPEGASDAPKKPLFHNSIQSEHVF